MAYAICSILFSLKHTCGHAKRQVQVEEGEAEPSRVEYVDDDGKTPLLVLRRKEFMFRDQNELIGDTPTNLLRFDCEVPRLIGVHELPLSHRPSYPYSEEAGQATQYATTRCPAWCDRVLMNKTGILTASQATSNYVVIGQDTAMGDHKVRSRSC